MRYSILTLDTQTCWEVLQLHAIKIQHHFIRQTHSFVGLWISTDFLKEKSSHFHPLSPPSHTHAYFNLVQLKLF